MEHRLVARSEARSEDPYLLPLAFGHPLDDLAKEQLGRDDNPFLS